MSEKTQRAIFVREMQRRIDDLIDWIVENSRDNERILSRDDFQEVRNQLCAIASDDATLQITEPEPEQGGAQYINDNPAPWP